MFIRKEIFERGIRRKQQTKWRGPFEVIEMVRDVGAYRLKDQLHGKIVSRAVDKIKPADVCDEFFVGNCNDDISDDESST